MTYNVTFIWDFWTYNYILIFFYLCRRSGEWSEAPSGAGAAEGGGGGRVEGDGTREQRAGEDGAGTAEREATSAGGGQHRAQPPGGVRRGMNGILIYELPIVANGTLVPWLSCLLNISQIIWECFAFWFSCKNLHKNWHRNRNIERERIITSWCLINLIPFEAHLHQGHHITICELSWLNFLKAHLPCSKKCYAHGG